MLEEEKPNGTLCVSIPNIPASGREHFKSLHHHLNSLDKLHKFSLGLSNSYLQPRTKNKISRDIDLGKRVGEKIKKHLQVSVDREKLKAEDEVKKISCRSNRLLPKYRARTVHQAYTNHFQDLWKISKVLLQRFWNKY